MEESGVWPVEHAKLLAHFFFELELQPRKWQANSKKSLIIYQSCVQHVWFDAIKRNKGFNIELIKEELLHSITEELNNSIQEHNMEQVRSLLSASSQPLPITILPSASLHFPPPPCQTAVVTPCCCPCHLPFAICCCCLPSVTCCLPFADVLSLACHCAIQQHSPTQQTLPLHSAALY